MAFTRTPNDSRDAHVLGGLRKSGDPCRNRTCDNLLRRQVLYPAELRGRMTEFAPGQICG